MNKKVNLFIIGVNKSGTTWLYHILKKHPDISFSDKKELDYFNNEYPEKLDKYHEHFQFDLDSKYFAEGSPSYIRESTTAKNIASYNPKSKIIIILRDPIIRLLSQFYFRKQIGKIPENLNFNEAIQGKDPLIIEDSHYEKLIPPWIKYFEPDQYKIFSMEKSLSNKNELWHNLIDFLNIETRNFPKKMDKSKNITGSKNFRFLYKYTILPIKRNLPLLYQNLLNSKFMKLSKSYFLDLLGQQDKQIDKASLEFLKNEFKPTYDYLYSLGFEDVYQPEQLDSKITVK